MFNSYWNQSIDLQFNQMTAFCMGEKLILNKLNNNY